MPRKGFLDIDSMLCEEDRIPVEFVNDVNGLRHLDPASDAREDDENSILKDTKTEVPLWLAKELSKKSIVKVNIPKHYGKIMQDEIKAGAKNINFKEYSQYYFEVGQELYKIKRNIPNVGKPLNEATRKAFCGDRYKDLMINSLSSQYADEDSEYAQTLTCSDAIIFNEGVRAGRSLMRWKARTSFLLPKASILGRRNASSTIDDNVKRAKIIA